VEVTGAARDAQRQAAAAAAAAAQGTHAARAPFRDEHAQCSGCTGLALARAAAWRQRGSTAGAGCHAARVARGVRVLSCNAHLIDRHSLVFVAKRPLGVSMEIEGGLNGYVGGNTWRRPWGAVCSARACACVCVWGGGGAGRGGAGRWGVRGCLHGCGVSACVCARARAYCARAQVRLARAVAGAVRAGQGRSSAHQAAVVGAALKVAAWCALQHKVPLQQVGGQRVRLDVRHGLLPHVRITHSVCVCVCGGVLLELERACMWACVAGGTRGTPSTRVPPAPCDPPPPPNTHTLTRSRPLYSFCSRVMQPFCADAMAVAVALLALLLTVRRVHGGRTLCRTS
jgi:hypothetical protein